MRFASIATFKLTRFPKHTVGGGSGSSANRRARWRRGLALTASVLGMLVVVLAGMNAVTALGVAPRLLGPYIERRSSGHNPLISTLGRWTAEVLQQLDRGDPPLEKTLPTWVGANPSRNRTQTVSSAHVATAEQLTQALAVANPGDTITLAPGRYRFSGHSLPVQRAGRADAPISLKADVLGTVVLEFDLLEGFHIGAPYWRFENLQIRGVCREQDNCEHAFHIVGGAHHVVLLNNDVRDFNAHIKINGSDGRFPDAGQIVNNTLANGSARKTDAPVTPIDLVAASRWRIDGNLIADFVKDGGDLTSYGAFAKGGGSENQFTRNAIICERALYRAPGRRVGLSFGGGGTGASSCRDGRCAVEHENGLIAGNLIASCSDDAIYINRSSGSKLLHNTALDTAGVEVRFAESVAALSGNLIDGPLRVRGGATVFDGGNSQTTAAWLLYLGLHPVRDLFADSAALDLRLVVEPLGVRGTVVAPDLCHVQPPRRRFAGAFDNFDDCKIAPAL